MAQLVMHENNLIRHVASSFWCVILYLQGIITLTKVIVLLIIVKGVIMPTYSFFSEGK